MAETKNLTIMFTDIKGFTQTTSAKKREDLEKFLDLHEDLVAPVFEKHHGKIVKTIGDAFMVIFHSPTNAVLCGMEIQDKLKEYNKGKSSKDKVEVRVAVNSGEVNVRGNDYFGEPVNIAARIEGIAEANEVYFTESVYLAMNKKEIPSAEIGYRKLKGIPEEIKVYRVLKEGEYNSYTGEIERRKTKLTTKLKNLWVRRKKWIIGIIIILFLLSLLNAPMNIIKKEKNIDDFIQKADRVIRNGNYEQARKMTSQLEKIPRNEIPPKLALSGADLYLFLREPEGAIEMLKLAKSNFPTKEEVEQINNFINDFLVNASSEQKKMLQDLLKD